MKKFIFMTLLMLFSITCFGQFNMPNRVKQFINEKDYELVDSLPLEHIMIHFNKEIDNENFIKLGEGDYLAPLPHNDNFVVKYNADKTKAIVIRNSYAFGRHFEFDIQNNERRTIFYYQDKNIYCGYVYDKEFKVCKYFESKKEFKRFIKHRLFDPRFSANLKRLH